ncbi:MAG TPA: NYN domain-containing protein [Blastocatellia bacterium]|nr:NYN domain-containing protein [Blastocatellia bacterium]
MPHKAFGFVDGGYVRKRASEAGADLINPRALIQRIVNLPLLQGWCATPQTVQNVGAARVIYYDARPDNDTEISEDLKEYWDAVELLEDTDLGFGSMRGGTTKKPPRQKGVDTLIAVDMLVGSFTKLFAVAILVAGDADFVPILNEVRRQGVMVVVAAWEKSTSADLKRAADRFLPLEPFSDTACVPPLIVDGRRWKA